MKKLYQIIYVATLFFLIIGCSTTTDSETLKNNAEIDEASKGIFYKVEETSNTVYLLGSIHVGSEDIYPLHENIEEAFAESDYLAVEVDISDLNELEMMQLLQEIGVYMDGRSLSQVIGDDHFEKLTTLLSPYGYDDFVLNMFKPFIVQDLLSVSAASEAGFDPDYGIDMYFLEKAEGNMEIISLETYEDQLQLGTILSEETQVEELITAIDTFDQGLEELETLMNIWRTGDEDSLLEYRVMDESRSEDYQEYLYALMDERDYEMAGKVEEFILGDANETYFVVVGAMHLVGDTSIIGLLKERGYEIQAGLQ
ncbi:TraB/GumN family protein [Evansella sp. AB-rgal1]|uniref:TraB/GumN family protein n=1 Tax=Evansella sp. AB-rgal1 TaxID=3242696 RepID=UPI00359E4425